MQSSLLARAVRSGAALLRIGLLLTPFVASADPEIEEHPARLRIEAPSEVVAGEPFRVTVLLENRWDAEGPVLPDAGVPWGAVLDCTASDPDARLPSAVRIARDAGGRVAFDATLSRPGLETLEMRGEDGLSGRSAPIRVHEARPDLLVYWGDLHGHLHTPGRGHDGAIPADEYGRLVGEAFAFARDAANLDFCALTPHIQTAGGLANPDATGRTPWDALLGAVARANDPERFVVLPGFEWQGPEGDHCVVMPEPGPLVAPADFGALADSVIARQALLSAHQIYLPSTFEYYTPALEAVEVTRDAKSTEEIGLDAIRKGLVPAFLGCSDTHGGALGATSITGVRARARTAEAILEAIRARRTWATNGERIVLDFSVDHLAPVPRVTVRGVGTAPIDVIEIYRNAELVARATGFPETPEFEFVWEDEDLLHTECVAGPLVYHAKVIQTSLNQYAPSRRDLAIASPVAIELSAAQWEESYRRRGGIATLAPGAVLGRVHDAWNRLRVDPLRSLRSPVPERPAEIPDARIASLREAVEAFATLAAIDTSLVPLSRDLATLPAVARTFEAARRVDELITSGATRTKLLEAARETNEAASDARAALIRSRRPELERAWSAVAGVEARAERAWREAERIALHGRSPVLARAGDVERLALPGDPRLWMEHGTDPARALELRESFRERMGYTSPPQDLASEPAIVVRVVAEGAPRSGALVDPRDGFTVSLESTRRGWVARWPFSHWPGPEDPAPVLTFDPIARVEAVYFDRENGHPIFPWPHVRAARLSRAGIAAKLAVTVEGDSVVAELVAEPVAGPTRTLWCGRLPEGPHERAFVLPSPDVRSLVLRWGRAGWRRVASVEIPGHDAARPLGFGVLADGRALVPIGGTLSIVDPSGGEVREIPWPEGHVHDAGREFCVANLADGRALVRGADAGGGWAYFLDAEAGTWSPVPSGPESGTVAAHPDGGYGWLTGREIRRRDASGRDLAPLAVDRTGRLLGFDPSGHPVVRLESGDAVRLNPANGGVVNGVPGPALAMESSGAVVRLASLDARHREVALAVDLELGLTDGSTAGPFRLPFRPFPAEGQPAVRAAIAPDGSLFLLGGTTWWRHAPENDWWGATLERWEPLWTGESADPHGGP